MRHSDAENQDAPPSAIYETTKPHWVARKS